MPSDPARPITETLEALKSGRAEVADELLPRLYQELRKTAQNLMAKERPGQTLQATALVHEAYVRLVGEEDPGWDGRAHFFGAAARAMRQILIEQARRKSRRKHGGELKRENVDEIQIPIEMHYEDVLAFDEALERLLAADPRAAEVVHLRFFAGLTAEDTASALGISLATVERDWRFARTFLHSQLESS